MPSEVLRHVLVGPALNHLLDQRGYRAARQYRRIDGRAVPVGSRGSENDDCVACLLDGRRSVSDDVAAIALDDAGPVVRSGYPSMKLDPAAVDADPPVEPPEQVHSGRPRRLRTRHDRPQPRCR
ncbi:hypothetical protein C9J85_03195 [Haloferax sp. wsp5]|nr:hypothetical protein C9J85_03195 [Haloferax sp. wsp5]